MPVMRSSGRSHGPDGNGLWHVSAAPAAADDATADATAATDAATADAATSVLQMWRTGKHQESPLTSEKLEATCLVDDEPQWL